MEIFGKDSDSGLLEFHESFCFSQDTLSTYIKDTIRDGFEFDSNSRTRRLARVFPSLHPLATRTLARHT